MPSFVQVQRFFQTAGPPDRDLFKSLLGIDSPHPGGVRFAFRGSGMVTEIAQCPANDTAVSARTMTINLPAISPMRH